MILGFHYHVPAYKDKENIFVPGYIGVFLDGLAKEVDELILFLHIAKSKDEIKNANYKLKSNNIKLHLLPPKSNLFLRNILMIPYMYFLKKKIEKIDVFLIRVPTPLLINFMYLLKNKKYAYLIVGDYIENLESTKKNINIIKYFILKIYYQINKFFQNKYADNAILLTNNYFFKKYYENRNLKIKEIKTTTLYDRDIYKTYDLFNANKIRIAYSGRIEKSKGIEVLIKVIEELKNRGINVVLNIAGWDPTGNKYLNKLNEIIKSKHLEKEVVFHGFKAVGNELLEFYRDNDVLIVPTIGNEGFPRVIWEGMSQGVPVVASKVGAIPHVLTNNKNCILVTPGEEKEIIDAVLKLKNDSMFRNKLVNEAFKLVKDNTIEKQSKKLINILKGEI